MLSKRLSELSCNCKEFAKAATPYNIAIKTSGYHRGLAYDDHATDYPPKKKLQAQYGLIPSLVKDGSRENIDCPDAILFYRKIMGGVELTDQMAGLYDLDRKPLKWWKKVIFRCLLFTSVNAWVI